MYNHPMYNPYVNHIPQNLEYEPFDEIREEEEYYQADDADEAPTTAPPSEHPPISPESPEISGYHHAHPIVVGKNDFCNCLGKWGIVILKRPRRPFGRTFWFYTTEVRINGVSGYIYYNRRRYKANFSYSQVQRFICRG
ncbi:MULTISPECIES: hypothetical protein [Bacillus cereus group]|uniref:Uncharacterized protein n=1 Tax=Bacillus cereus TaxID=1396 RepID=A0A9W7QKS6_BACCE|nr:hypothetical protein [Bacillus cereus]KAB2400689.1 hypothetical protein F8172_00335 [Bacillus cereus]KAB2405894.1 hypothetical protein F8170_14290 [Bacillus cereus]KAB2431373.1 hypothetical protein F8168_04560 [Bacillus cereus]